jgi:hypothetical protein
MMHLMEEIERQAGMACTILLGGPEPKRGGKIIVMTFHTGKTRFGHNFEQAYDAWYENVEVPFTEHMGKVFCE